MYEDEGHFASLGCLGGLLGGSWGAFWCPWEVWGGLWRGLGEVLEGFGGPWTPKLIKSQKNVAGTNLGGHILGGQNVSKINKNRFQKRVGLQKGFCQCF